MQAFISFVMLIVVSDLSRAYMPISDIIMTCQCICAIFMLPSVNLYLQSLRPQEVIGSVDPVYPKDAQNHAPRLRNETN